MSLVVQRLQDELLRRQDELRKTIVFVTHDFDEAVKLGDEIAILQQGSRIVQDDTPEEILANPADDSSAVSSVTARHSSS